LEGDRIVWMDYSQGEPAIMTRSVDDDPILLLEKADLATNGSLIVWSDNRGDDWDIFGFDFYNRFERPLVRAPGDQREPDVGGDLLVWADNRKGDWDVRALDLSSGVETIVAEGRGDQMSPSVYGSRVAWMDDSSGNWDVVVKDLDGAAIKPPASKAKDQMYPVVSGDLLVWQDDRSGDEDVYALDLATGEETKLTGEGDQVHPHVSGDLIVWEDSTTGDVSYYFWERKWGRAYSRDGVQIQPKVYGKRIVYQERTEDGWSIRSFEPNTWKDREVASGSGEIDLDFDSRLAWLISPSGKFGYQNLGSDQISVICQASGDQTSPAVSGDWVVWMDNRTENPDIYLYNLIENVEWPLAAGPELDMYPEIMDDVVVWMYFEEQFDSWAIRTLDIPTVNRTQLQRGISVPTRPSISEEMLAWGDLPIAGFGWRVQKKPLYTTETMEAIPPRGENPDAGGSVVVYQDDQNGDEDIYIWSGTTRRPLYSGAGDQTFPTTDGKIVVWQDDRNGNWDLYSSDLATGKVEQLTSDPSDQTSPHLRDGILVWQDDRNGDWDIRAMDLSTRQEMEIYTGPGDQTDPRTGDSKIVWVDDRKGDKDVYMYEIYRE
jgi:beta propeller repeat protein